MTCANSLQHHANAMPFISAARFAAEFAHSLEQMEEGTETQPQSNNNCASIKHLGTAAQQKKP